MQFLSLFATILASSVLAADSFEVVAKAKNLTVLVDIIAIAGLTDTINGLSGVTIFAPSNQAFADIGAFAAKINLTVTKEIHYTVLTLHLIPEIILSSDIISATEPISATALSEENITATAKYGTVLISGNGNSYPAKVIEADIPVSQGIVHIIDRVLFPESFGVKY